MSSPLEYWDVPEGVFFRCARSKTMILKTAANEALIQTHQTNCDWCQKTKREMEKPKEQYRDGRLDMMYQLAIILKMKDKINTFQNRIKKERREKKENYEYIIKLAQSDIETAKHYMQKAEQERDRLLNDIHADENYRRGVIDMYEEYKSKGLIHQIQLEPKYYWHVR